MSASSTSMDASASAASSAASVASLSAVTSITSAASSTLSESSSTDTGTTLTRSAFQETATKAGEGYTYSSSSIVRVALAAGIIVLGVCALLLFMKISAWVRYRQRLSRERTLRAQHASEQRARAFELAAWADTPGQAPVDGRAAQRRPWWKRREKDKDADKDKEKSKRGRGLRGKTNAYAVYEWEGVPA